MKSILRGSAIAIVAAALFAQAPPAAVRTILLTKDVSVPGKEAVIAKVTMAPGGTSGRHTHPGEEISTLIEGQMDIYIDGQPVAHYKTGDAFVIPNHAIHEARNPGTVPVVLSTVYLIDKGQAVATPVAN